MSEAVWMEIATGGRVTIPDPLPNEMDIDSIAQSLSRTCRFRGHCVEWYSVAEHSVYVSLLCERMARNGGYDVETRRQAALYGLLHDASEAILCDVAAPTKSLLSDYRQLEQRVQDAAYREFGLQPLATPFAVWLSSADLGLLRHEAEQNMPSKGRTWNWDGVPHVPPVKLRYLERDDAKAVFLNRYRDLTPERYHGPTA